MADLDFPKKRRASEPMDWVNRIIGGAVGAFVAGILALAWGDTRYLRRDEFKNHAEAQSKLEEHAQMDVRNFATKEDLTAHVNAPSHTGTIAALASVGAQLADVQAKLAVLNANLEWLKSREQHRKEPR